MVNTHLKVGDYEAWVVVENDEVEHYGIEVNEETKVVTCWIASTAGKVSGFNYLLLSQSVLIGFSTSEFGLPNIMIISIVQFLPTWTVPALRDYILPSLICRQT
jgi:hypothetical protein